MVLSFPVLYEITDQGYSRYFRELFLILSFPLFPGTVPYSFFSAFSGCMMVTLATGEMVEMACL